MAGTTHSLLLISETHFVTICKVALLSSCRCSGKLYNLRGFCLPAGVMVNQIIMRVLSGKGGESVYYFIMISNRPGHDFRPDRDRDRDQES